MQIVTDILVIIGAIAVLYAVITGLRKLQSVIRKKRQDRLERLAQSGSIHLNVLGRIDEIEAFTKQHLRDIERKLKSTQEDFDAVGDLDRDVQNLATIVHAQKQQIDALNAAHKILSRRIARLDEEITGNGDDIPETVDEEYAAL